jgi:Fe-S cluster biogenesis protein NfuA
MPKIADIEPTPNPNAVKFILREPLTWGISCSYASAEQAADDPLASALFAIEHVTNVFYVDHWLTVTQDGQADWETLVRQLAVPIRAAAGADENSARLVDQAPAAQHEMSPEEQERFTRINELIDRQVRPYLQGDGGDLHLLGLRDTTLTLHYQGACGTCPSSISGTLAAIRNLVHSIEPDIEIVAV